MLDPASIAIVGLSDNAEKHGARVLRNLQTFGFQGPIYGVHPQTPFVDSVTMVAATGDLPAVDLVLCAIPAASVPGAVRDLKGPAVVVVFSGGFSEAQGDGVARQAELVDAIAHNGVRILGPNSGGVIAPAHGLAASFLTFLDRPSDQIKPGPVGVVSQSGGIMSYLNNLAAGRGQGIGASVSTGNEADLTIADAISAVAELDGIRSIALIVETIRDGAGFIEAVTAAHARGIRVAACHLGRTESSRHMLATHTGALATNRRVFEGVCRSLGIGLADTPEEVFDAADVLARTRILGGPGVGMVTHSGGVAILLSDLADARGLGLAAPGSALKEKVAPFMQLGAVKNPLDMGAIIGGPGRFGSVVEAFGMDENYDIVLAVSSAHPPAHTPERVDSLLAIDSVPIVHLWMAGDQVTDSLARLRAEGAAVVTDPRAAIAALAGAVAFYKRDTSQPIARPGLTPQRVLSEHDSKQFLGERGLPVVEGELVTNQGAALAAFERFGGRVVAKVSSPDLLHKAEIGAMRLNLTSAESVADAYEEVLAAVDRARPDARIEGVRIERQVSVEVEVFVSAFFDPVFGPMVALGKGGSRVEEQAHLAMSLAPVSLEFAERLVGVIDQLDDATTRSLAELVVLISELPTGTEPVEAEINPLGWTGSSWVALDAVVRI